jgi:hypothetical protein
MLIENLIKKIPRPFDIHYYDINGNNEQHVTIYATNVDKAVAKFNLLYPKKFIWRTTLK